MEDSVGMEKGGSQRLQELQELQDLQELQELQERGLCSSFSQRTEINFLLVLQEQSGKWLEGK